jgi:AraC-like DNA-binding protein
VLISESRGVPLFVNDVCRAAGVSERTLRNVFHEYVGVGPMRLLKVRQLHETRSALLAADPDLVCPHIERCSAKHPYKPCDRHHAHRRVPPPFRTDG